jgi:hypothetical protein
MKNFAIKIKEIIIKYDRFKIDTLKSANKYIEETIADIDCLKMIK